MKSESGLETMIFKEEGISKPKNYTSKADKCGVNIIDLDSRCVSNMQIKYYRLAKFK